MTIDWMNPSDDVVEAKRVGYQEGLAEQEAEVDRLRARLHDLEAYGGISEVIQENAVTQENNRALTAEVERLRTELRDLADGTFRAIAYEVKGTEGYRGDLIGWWDTCALSAAMDLGDLLVELGTWERHPKGWGRRWFYRPVEAEEAKEKTP